MIVRCAECKNRFEVPEYVRANVQCPKCNHYFRPGRLTRRRERFV
ncbi:MULTISPECIES: zinc-ribbon domain-containing protein [Haloprofundus]|nr:MULTISPECIES: zinc-ribbon domain-containing protein [Haloprofundus]QCJ48161.1 hypothetical protein FCF25_13960 [Haloprofundus sp. MHR1]